MRKKLFEEIPKWIRASGEAIDVANMRTFHLTSAIMTLKKRTVKLLRLSEHEVPTDTQLNYYYPVYSHLIEELNRRKQGKSQPTKNVNIVASIDRMIDDLKKLKSQLS